MRASPFGTGLGVNRARGTGLDPSGLIPDASAPSALRAPLATSLEQPLPAHQQSAPNWTIGELAWQLAGKERSALVTREGCTVCRSQ
jgi:hypothetical protein